MADSIWHWVGHFAGGINTIVAQNYILDSSMPDSLDCYQSAGIHIIVVYMYIYIYINFVCIFRLLFIPYGIL